MVFPPLRPFSLVITGCLIPVLLSLFGTPNTYSQAWEVQLPHVCLFTSSPLVQLPQYDVAVSVRPFPIGCYCDVMQGKHLPHISCNQTSFLYCFEVCSHRKFTHHPTLAVKLGYNYPPYSLSSTLIFQRGQEFLKPGVMWLGPFNEITGLHIQGVTSGQSPMLGPVIVQVIVRIAKDMAIICMAANLGAPSRWGTIYSFIKCWIV